MKSIKDFIKEHNSTVVDHLIGKISQVIYTACSPYIDYVFMYPIDDKVEDFLSKKLGDYVSSSLTRLDAYMKCKLCDEFITHYNQVFIDSIFDINNKNIQLERMLYSQCLMSRNLEENVKIWFENNKERLSKL